MGKGMDMAFYLNESLQRPFDDGTTPSTACPMRAISIVQGRGRAAVAHAERDWPIPLHEPRAPQTLLAAETIDLGDDVGLKRALMPG